MSVPTSMNENMAVFAKRTIQVGSLTLCIPAFVTAVCGLVLGLLLGLTTNIWA